jgi:hypothetical protein
MKMFCSHGRVAPAIFTLFLIGSTFTLYAQFAVPRPDHVVIVVEENHGFGKIIKSSGPRYINSLAQTGALFIASYAIRHPSEPNYLALLSGSTQGVTDDRCSGRYGTSNLVSELLRVGLTFSGYSESLPQVGFIGCKSGQYARKHNPWVDFTNLPPALNLPLTTFPTNFDDLPTVSFVVPNQVDDMHSGSVGRGDTWLRQHLDSYVQWAQTNNSLLMVTWDEDDRKGNNRVATIFVGPMVRPGKYCEHITHYNVLRTLLEMYGLTPMARATNANPITSCWKSETVSSPLTIELTPTDGTIIEMPATIALRAEASSSDSTITKVEFFRLGAKLGEATNSPFTMILSNVAPGTSCFFAQATDALGRTRMTPSSFVTLVPKDLTRPTVALLSPPPNSRVSNAVVTLSGTARDNTAVTRVEVQADGGSVQTASGTTHWSTEVTLSPGTNLIRLKSVDYFGNESAPATAQLIYVVTSPLTLLTVGEGAVSPDLSNRNGLTLEVGRVYTIMAQPAAGNLFTGWSEGATSAAVRLTFLMQSNLALQANFVTNPFIATRGSYTGLFYDTNDVRHESSGLLTLALAERGSFLGQVQSSGRAYPFSGQFDLGGRAHAPVSLSGGSTLNLQLNLQPASGELGGSVSNANWAATLRAGRPNFNVAMNPAPFRGAYTLDVLGGSEAPASPAGDSVASVHVAANGAALLAGTLADGTSVTAHGPVLSDGTWPFYLSLYGGRGSIFGWLQFTNAPEDHMLGSLNWFKIARPANQTYAYTNGFAETALPAFGSRYYPPVGATGRVLEFTNGLLEFDGTTSAGFTNEIVLEQNGHITNLSSNGLVMTLSGLTGLWSGTVVDPGTSQSLPFRGVVLQKRQVGVGFYRHDGQSSRVALEQR